MPSTEQDPGARLRMITVAERLFAERGLDAVSMRLVATEAGQRNNSAVAYHFGSREGLVRAILEHRSGPIDARRCELIAEIDATGHAITVAEASRILVQPMAETVSSVEHDWYLRFLAEATSEPDHHLTVPTQPRGIVWVNEKLAAQMSDQPPTVVRRRLRWMVVIALRVLADHEQIALTGGAPTVDDVVSDLTRTLTALLNPR
ncbi:MAG: TetR/AcrR family transcriptional regulator [Nocardioides sp.]|nr:TetR/AcrR family transcriptional regulator [Nocardioides sp.]